MATTAAASQQPIAPAKSGKRKRIIVIAVGAIVLAGAGGGGAYFWLHKPAAHEPAKPAPVVPPVFFPLESMTVNLQSDDGMHYLRIGLTLKLPDEKAQAALAERMPEVRSHILMLLSAKHPDDLAGIDGKRALAKELLNTVNTYGGSPEAPAHVQEVLFTEIVVQ